MQTSVGRKLGSVARAGYERLSPYMRRWLPAALKRRLFGLVGAIEAKLKVGADVPSQLLATAPTLLPSDAFAGGPIVCVNNGLAWGGAERQLVNTLLGLEAHTSRRIVLLCQKLGEHADYDFYLPMLRTQFRGEARNFAPLASMQAVLESCNDHTAHVAIAWLPLDVRERILRLMGEFVTLRPRVVPHGIIVCDDYGFDTCPGARQAMDTYFADRKVPIVHLPTGQGLVIRTA